MNVSNGTYLLLIFRHRLRSLSLNTNQYFRCESETKSVWIRPPKVVQREIETIERLNFITADFGSNFKNAETQGKCS